MNEVSHARNVDILRSTSDKGPRARGPNPRPMTKRLSPSVATTREQLKSLVIWSYVKVYMEEVHVLRKNQHLHLLTH